MLTLLERSLAVPTPKGTGTPRKGPRPRSNLLLQLFKVVHQRVRLELDFANRQITGFTEVTATPISLNLRVVRLDAREMRIKEVYINGQKANFILRDFLYINDLVWFNDCVETGTVNLWDLYLKNISINQHHILRQKLNYIFGDIHYDPLFPSERIESGNTEELLVLLPEKLDDYVSNTPSSVTPLHLRNRGTQQEAPPFLIGVEYELVHPKNGVHFMCEGEEHLWHAYTVNSEYNISTLSWVPCVDNFWEKNTWLVELTVPRSIKQEEDEEETHDLYVCTGDSVNTKETPHPDDLNKKIVLWSIFNPVSAHHVGWAVGSFESVEITESATPPEADDDFDIGEKDHINVSYTLHYLPGQKALAKNTCSFVGGALLHFAREYGSFPFSSYGIVFVQGPAFPRHNYAGLTLLDEKVLYPEDVIEPMFAATEDILECVAGQWLGINIVPQLMNDLWCTLGIARFMGLQYTKQLMGYNEYRHRIKQKMDEICRLDINQEPIGVPAIRYPLSEADLDFMRLKAPIVLFTLDRRMTKTNKSFGLLRVLPKIFLQAMSGDLPNGALSTQHLQNVCEKVNRNRLEMFFKQWVYGAGTPVFQVTQRYNKKRLLIEVVFRQLQLAQLRRRTVPQADTFMHDAIDHLYEEHPYPVQQAFVGPMTIRVHESDGTPYEHIVDIKDRVAKFDVLHNTKQRKLKKRDEGVAMPPVFAQLGDIKTTEADLKEWNFAEWPKRDEELGDPYEWIRVDADFEWIAQVRLKQPDFMFRAQLQHDKDVDAQILAVRYFGTQSQADVVHCTTLTRTLLDDRYHHGVRTAAAQALADISNPTNNFAGLPYLLRAFQSMFCFEDSTIPFSNSFEDFGKLFLLKAIFKILASVKDDDGRTPQPIKNLLLNFVKYNDNSTNEFQDCFYVKELVEALTVATLPPVLEPSLIDFHLEKHQRSLPIPEKAFVDRVVEELGRLQKLDAWVPLYQSVITRTCLEQRIQLARHNYHDLSLEYLLNLTTKNIQDEIRLVAFRGLFLLGGFKNRSIMKYILHILLLENSRPFFKTHLVKAIEECVSQVAIHGSPSMFDDPEFQSLERILDKGGKSTVVVEDIESNDLDTRRDAYARLTVKGTIELLRRDYSIGTGIRSFFWELIHSSLLSLQERKVVFRICEVLFKEVDSFPVSLSIPPVPVEELKRKIVAKYAGDGVVVIKREGRFKILLGTRILTADLRPKPERRSERHRAATEKTPAPENESVKREPEVLEPVLQAIEPIQETAEERAETAEPIEEAAAQEEQTRSKTFEVTFSYKPKKVKVEGTSIRIDLKKKEVENGNGAEVNGEQQIKAEPMDEEAVPNDDMDLDDDSETPEMEDVMDVEERENEHDNRAEIVNGNEKDEIEDAKSEKDETEDAKNEKQHKNSGDAPQKSQPKLKFKLKLK